MSRARVLVIKAMVRERLGVTGPRAELEVVGSAKKPAHGFFEKRS